MPLSPKYLIALAHNNEAIESFKRIQTAYRLRLVSDVDYLAARAAYDKAMTDFDAVYAAEQKGQN